MERGQGHTELLAGIRILYRGIEQRRHDFHCLGAEHQQTAVDSQRQYCVALPCLSQQALRTQFYIETDIGGAVSVDGGIRSELKALLGSFDEKQADAIGIQLPNPLPYTRYLL
ncbi:hypothetical protein [Spongiibacter thalassae]|uniref:hypothetical protein n=1 Tax=Spongiibacter thalassae TaxID=2721624 RepID=UPI001FF08062|nr:hypothetical protein [Spongiibacter thalassae]